MEVILATTNGWAQKIWALKTVIWFQLLHLRFDRFSGQNTIRMQVSILSQDEISMLTFMQWYCYCNFLQYLENGASNRENILFCGTFSCLINTTVHWIFAFLRFNGQLFSSGRCVSNIFEVLTLAKESQQQYHLKSIVTYEWNFELPSHAYSVELDDIKLSKNYSDEWVEIIRLIWWVRMRYLIHVKLFKPYMREEKKTGFWWKFFDDRVRNLSKE